MVENISNQLHALVKDDPQVNFRKIFESELFGLAMKQVSLYIHSAFGNNSEKSKEFKDVLLFAGFGRGRAINLCGGAWYYFVKKRYT